MKLAQKETLLLKERFRNQMALPESGTETGTWEPPFQSKTGKYPKKPAGDQKKKRKGQKSFSVMKHATKWNILPQDAVYPSCVCGNAVSMSMCVRLQHGKSLSHKFLVTENFGEKISPCISPSFTIVPRQLLWVTVEDKIPGYTFNLTTERWSRVP